MPLQFKRVRIDRIPRKDLLAALVKAAEHHGFLAFGKREFNAGSFGCSATRVQAEFGSWKAGIAALREELAKQGKALTGSTRNVYSDGELFGEMERIWHLCGQRPSRYQWEEHSPRYSYNTYKHRFGGWSQACLSFIENRMGTPIQATVEAPPTGAQALARQGTVRKSIPARFRLQVLDRDCFRCILCGRSPAMELGVVLHLDHIVPVSRGGENTLANLRTLCAHCNLGRGNVVELGA